MDKDFETSISNFKINILEYCTLMEDIIIPDDKEAYIKVNKLMVYCSEAEYITVDTMFINDEECKPTITGSISVDDKIKVPIISSSFGPNEGIPIYSTMTDQEGANVKVQTGQKIPKGSTMIAIFMDNNINDGYLTTWVVL